MLQYLGMTQKWPRIIMVLAVLGGLAVIIIPACLASYPPFLDLIAHCSINSYPAKLSYGPEHYYVLQLTYILHFILTRVMTDLGLSVVTIIKLYYIGQAAMVYGAILYLLSRFINNGSFLILAAAIAPLGIYDGLFLWGGPPDFSIM